MKKILLSLILCLTIGCQPEAENTESNTRASTEYPQRIVTLSPHLTELIFSLGAESRLVATVEYSDYPEAAKKIPRIGNAFQLDWEALTALNPDLVIAWQGGNPDALLDQLEQKGFTLMRLQNAELFDLPQQIRLLAKRLGITAGTDDLAQSYLKDLHDLKQSYAAKSRHKVFYQISAEPIYTVDGTHTISDMLELCGGVNVIESLGKISAPVSPEAVLAAAPEVIMTTSASYAAVVKNWDGVFPSENIVAISGDEVSRASLRMAAGVRNICTVLDEWRMSVRPDE